MISPFPSPTKVTFGGINDHNLPQIILACPVKEKKKKKAVLMTLQTVFFRELEQIISQFVWKYKKPQIAKAILRKKNGTGGINLPDFRLSHSLKL